MEIMADKISNILPNILLLHTTNTLKDLHVYSTTQTLSRYQISVRVVSDCVFATDSTEKLYPGFNSDANDTITVNIVASIHRRHHVLK